MAEVTPDKFNLLNRRRGRPVVPKIHLILPGGKIIENGGDAIVRIQKGVETKEISVLAMIAELEYYRRRT
jgi:hypothetical protein